ncbi:MAG TPA: BON domain-containing protein, partial [Vicinamibacterales bacterium]|nr:BON domain-containing protein [Vicinamibacterales bacterium]
LIGYWFWQSTPRTTGAAGTSGTMSQREEAAREKGRAVGEKIAVATEKVKENVSEAALTTKIKAKMALDDSVKARSIDVTTSGTTVTLTGTVHSQAERDKAVALARETNGITNVVDRLTIAR